MLVDQIQNNFSSVFSDELGAFHGETVKLRLSEEAKSIFYKPRPLPFMWKSKVEQMIRKLVDQGMLEQVDSSDWATPLVPILKRNGELRVCAD